MLDTSNRAVSCTRAQQQKTMNHPGSTEGVGDTFDDNSYGIDGETTTRGT